MAALVSYRCLHDAITVGVGAVHDLWYFPSVVWYFHVAAHAMIIRLNLVMVVFENGFELLPLQMVIPRGGTTAKGGGAVAPANFFKTLY